MALTDKVVLGRITARELIAELHRARQELQVLRAVSDTVAAFSAALRAEPSRQGGSPDIVWTAEQEIQQADIVAARFASAMVEPKPDPDNED